MVSFKRWMKEFEDTETPYFSQNPINDLANDMGFDSRFPHGGSYSELRIYLSSSGAKIKALEVFDDAYRQYAQVTGNWSDFDREEVMSI